MSDLALSTSPRPTPRRNVAVAMTPAAADRASATVWISVTAAMIGAFMAILNIQITNASLLNIEGGI
jgi:DHA2 family multidrug resistance protein